MRPHRLPKIDLNAEYPCPCRRQGRMNKIALTEAFGCERCQKIFVLQEDGQTIEELSSTHPYKRIWRWTGQRWVSARSRWEQRYQGLVLIGVLTLALVVFMATLRSSAGVSKILLAFLVSLSTAILLQRFWLYRQR